MAVSELPFRQPAVAGVRDVHLPTKKDFDHHIDRVQHIATLVRRPSLTVDTLRGFWRGGSRAVQTVETHSRHLQLDLQRILTSVNRLLEQAEGLALNQFVDECGSPLMRQIDAVRPADPSRLDSEDAILECHYAVSVRAALLQHTLSTINKRYTKPQFENLRDATTWTSTFSALLADVEKVMKGTRQLLKKERRLAQRFLDGERSQLVRLEKRLRIHAPGREAPGWERVLNQAEELILDSLSAWSDALEESAFAGFNDAHRGTDLLKTVGQTVVHHAPNIGVGILALAAGATGAAMTRQSDDLQLSLPNPLREQAANNSELGLSSDGREIAVPSVERPSAETESAGIVDRVTDRVEAGTDSVLAAFRSMVPGQRQEVRVEDSTTLEAALAELEAMGYTREDVLGAMGIASPTELTEPATLELHVDEMGETELLVPELAAGYEVQRGDTFAGIAQRLGISEARLHDANAHIEDVSVIELGQVLTVPAVNLDDSSIDKTQIQRGATLDEVATAFDVTVEELVRLNRVRAPETWEYTGQELTLPMRVLDRDAAAAPAQQSLRADTATTAESQNPPQSNATETVSVDTEAAAEMFALKFDDAGEAEATTMPRTAPVGDAATAASYAEPAELSNERRSTTAAVSSNAMDGAAIRAKYGDTLFRSLDDMPADARAYFTGTIQEVSDFFNVRPGDIMGILRAETNDTGWRLYQPAVSSAGAKGVAQIVPRTWNGWGNPGSHSRHLTNMAEIVTHSGIGFDWESREIWTAWKAGDVPKSALADSNADPMQFEDSVASVAQHLVRWGLTRDAAENKPDWFESRLQDAIAVYNSGRVLSESANFTQSSANRKTVAEYVHGAMVTSDSVAGDFDTTVVGDLLSTEARRSLLERIDLLYDTTFGIDLSDHQIEALLAEQQMLLSDLDAGTLTPEQASLQFLDQLEQGFLAQGREVKEANERVPWPHIYNRETLAAQKLAVSQIGHMLDGRELAQLIEETGASIPEMRERLARRADAQLATMARELIEAKTGEPARNAEITALVQPLVAGKDPYAVAAATLSQLEHQLETRINEQYSQSKAPITSFAATPLNPMPRVVKAFGVPVNYQQGGEHTGIDIALPRDADGKEPALYAVDDGVVEYVGPLYCDAARKCRGEKALIIDHGNNVYSIYSHNSATVVEEGERVKAGQMVGRQGNEGFSYGSHLHFEVHVGAPYTGNWRQPWTGGQFVDPMDFIKT